MAEIGFVELNRIVDRYDDEFIVKALNFLMKNDKVIYKLIISRL